MAVVPPEKLGQAVVDGFVKLVKAIAGFVKKLQGDSSNA